MDLAGRTGLAARIVGAEPGGEPQRITGRAEMLVVPARATGRRRDEADRLVVDPLDEVRLAVLLRRNAGMFRPRVGVALALYADEHRRGGVGVGLGVAAVLVLADPQIERVCGHGRLDATPARRGPAGAPHVDHEIDFLIEVLLGLECARARHLDHVAPPFALGAVKLNISAAAAEPSPRRQRQVLHLADPDIAKHRNALGLHEEVVGRLRPAELAEAGALARRGILTVGTGNALPGVLWCLGVYIY